LEVESGAQGTDKGALHQEVAFGALLDVVRVVLRRSKGGGGGVGGMVLARLDGVLRGGEISGGEVCSSRLWRVRVGRIAAWTILW